MRDKAKHRTLLNHIARLNRQNSLLAECLVEERWRRQKLQKWYEGRLRSRLASFVDTVSLVIPQIMAGKH
jgi:hypothetical protein